MKYAFAICIAIFCALELFNAHLMDSYSYTEFAWSNLVILEMGILAVAGYVATTKRHKSTLAVIALWMVWILMTDWVPYFPAWLASIETGAFCVLIGWLMLRPRRLPNYLGPNVALGFYTPSDGLKITTLKQTIGRLIGRLQSLPGYPYEGVALVVDDKMMMPRRKEGKYVCVDLKHVPNRWTILGTPFDVSDEIRDMFYDLEDRPVTMANCVSSLRPALDFMGYHSKTPGMLAGEVLNGR